MVDDLKVRGLAFDRDGRIDLVQPWSNAGRLALIAYLAAFGRGVCG